MGEQRPDRRPVAEDEGGIVKARTEEADEVFVKWADAEDPDDYLKKLEDSDLL